MIVCVCNNVSEKEIRQAIELGATNMVALQRDLGVATCCGSCHDCAKQVLAETLEVSASAVA
jgi:bacterioferritin-associated ferredoxin